MFIKGLSTYVKCAFDALCALIYYAPALGLA